MSENKSVEFEFTSPVRMIFTDQLFTPKRYQDPKTKKEKGDPVYSTTFLLAPDSADLVAIKKICQTIGKEHSADFGRDAKGKPNTAWPFKNGDEKADELKARGKNGEVYRGTVYIQASTAEDRPPALAVFKDGNPKKGAIDLTPALLSQYKSWFFSGSNAQPVLRFWWYDSVNEGKPGIKAFLSMVVATNTGERIGGGKPASERFKGVVGQTTEENPLEDDEIPF